jgi:glycosyltransferase involved in cell wall biosynthesis
MLPYLGPAKRKEVFRTLLTRFLRVSPFHRYWMSKMTVIFAVNQDTLDLVRALGRSDVQMQFDNGVPSHYLAHEAKSYVGDQSITRFLWVGRMLPRKALPLALDALAQAQLPSTLTIVGNGLPREVVERMIADRGLNGRVHWAGRRLTVDEVRANYLEHDALLFTSVRETSGLQLIEAMALGLPVICLDLHGASVVVPNDAGFKIPVTTPADVVRRLAAALDQFTNASVEEKTAMSRASLRFARENTWSVRAQKAEELYLELLER